MGSLQCEWQSKKIEQLHLNNIANERNLDYNSRPKILYLSQDKK